MQKYRTPYSLSGLVALLNIWFSVLQSYKTWPIMKEIQTARQNLIY